MRILAETVPPNPILPLWQEIVVGLVAFGVVFFVLWRYVFPRMEEMFKARVDAIEGGIKRAEERQAEANALFEQYQRQLAEARTEAAKIRDQARADANGIREDILTQAREESERIVTAGRDQLDAQRATIVRELRAEMGKLAVDLASKIVGEALADEARKKGTVDRFLNELETAGER
ncbi:MAG: F0F1 ATP synthase subunit B [Actinobacteria bacterium 13_2_20CM_2_71_6]|nr:MAG: F0F1 ATP synthase subunit B [Actinobacteria bacterium 13_2_20CM_2_71_6]